MYCSKCGAENSDNSKYCVQCGEALIKYDNNNIQSENTSQNAALSDEEYDFRSRPYRSSKPWAWIIIISLIAIAGIYYIYNVIYNAVNNVESDKKIVETLQTFTVMDKVDGNKDEKSPAYVFKSSNGWTLKYTEANKYVIFTDSRAYKRLEDWFQIEQSRGFYFFGYTFVYDLNENAVRMEDHINLNTEKGHITSISYDMDSKEFIVRTDEKDWTVTNESEDYMFAKKLVHIFEEDIQLFTNELNTNKLSIDDVKNLKYKNIQE